MKPRNVLVKDLAQLTHPTVNILNELKEYPWDCDEDLYVITIEDVINVFEKYLSSEIKEIELEEWAESIEVCEDIGFQESYEEEIQEMIFAIANPILNQPIEKQLIHEYATKLDACRTRRGS